MRTYPPARVVCWLLAVGFALAGLARLAAAEITAEERHRGYRARSLLAQPRADLAAVVRAEAAEQLTLVRAHPRLGGIRMFEADSRDDVKADIDRLHATGAYAYVEPDFIRTASIVPNDPSLAA